MRRLMIGCLVAMGTSACGFSAPGPWDDGHIMIVGDAEGMRAFGDSMSGLISTGKSTDAMGRSGYFESRDRHEREKTIRKVAPGGSPGLLQKLMGMFSPAEPQGSVEQRS